MEPAAERRDDVWVSGGGVAADRKPQWSPPLNGGTTSIGGVPRIRDSRPQWSPPVNSRTTRCRRPAAATTRPRHNGARRLTAGRPSHRITFPSASMPPQWSPPVNDGRLDHLPVPGRPHGAAAMEPAGERRDDWRVRR